jgi:bud site selection protein 31
MQLSFAFFREKKTSERIVEKVKMVIKIFLKITLHISKFFTTFIFYFYIYLDFKMPLRNKRKAPPDGWELIEPTLDELDQKMREAEADPHEGKRKTEGLWPIFKIHHQKSRYIFDLFYKRKAISRELYDYCINEKIADASLIAKWKKQGYENLCCLRCIQTRDTNFGTNCVCRVPKTKLEEGKVVECVHCGCHGCSG